MNRKHRPYNQHPPGKILDRADARFEIKKLCDRSAIGGQRVISSVSQYSSFYSK
ncbi:hypothetical protein QUB37_10200 [Microcoleus sp. AT3-A2]|uniref:hypothetical protein n=1 Tax=unclassified Microcoleus TaxID=2642155 RepID=UPI002FD4339B